MVESVNGETLRVDALIFGGGIAGLWTLSRLRQLGYSAILVEAGRLGSGQTIASQGIIHGGVKYALGGAAGKDSAAIREMPETWLRCLKGEGEVDLSAARVLSERCFLWTTPGFGSRLMGLAASKAIRATPMRVSKEDRPGVFRDAPGSIDVYGLDEPVLDIASVLEAFASAQSDAIVHAPFPQSVRVVRGEQGIERAHIEVGVRSVEVLAERYVFCAGAGNAEYLSRLGPAMAGFVRMQRRPLHMVMARGALPALFGHAIGSSSTPLATITCAGSEGDRTWWIGGRVAEEGKDRGVEAQVRACREELARLIPWVDLAGVRFATWRVDRAEGAQPGGKRPAGSVVTSVGNAVFCWPTKLALAPRASGEILSHMAERASHPQPALEGPRPEVARAPWDEATEWIS